jgi:hypothetical protein
MSEIESLKVQRDILENLMQFIFVIVRYEERDLTHEEIMELAKHSTEIQRIDELYLNK